MMDSNLSLALSFRPERLVSPVETATAIPFLTWLLLQARPGVLVQLHAREGNLFFAACQLVADAGLATRCYAVDDSRDAEEATFIPEGGATASRQEEHSSRGRRFSGFSWWLDMPADLAVQNFDNGTVDFLILDGRRAADELHQLLQIWQSRLSPQSVVLLDGADRGGADSASTWSGLSDVVGSSVVLLEAGQGVLLLGNAVPSVIQDSVQGALASGVVNVLAERGTALVDAVQCRVQRQQLDHLTVVADALREELAERRQSQEQALHQHRQSQEQVRGLEDENRVLRSERDNLHDAHQAASQEVLRLTNVVQDILNSSCWRLTAPIRWLGDPINRARRKLLALYRFVALRGGVLNTSGRVMQLLRAEGIDGLRRRLQHAERMMDPQSAPPPGEPPRQESYHQWLEQNDPTDQAAMEALRARVDGAALNTRFSVVMPVYNPPLDYLRQAIESVQAQVYTNWELCIADDASPRQEVRNMLSEMAAADPRIKLVFCAENGGISEASNAALRVATGDFIALLDNDDMLTPHALAHMVLAIAANPQADMLYSDEDKIDEHNVRRDPYFKSDFNYELFLAQNMVCHLGVYRRSIVERIGGFRRGYEGAQDWDLALRMVETVGQAAVVHVPRVLYHWRAIAGSTALALGEKNYAHDAQLKSVASHLQRIGKTDSRVEVGPEFGLLRVRHAIPADRPIVSIVIPTRDRVELISMCVDSILEKTGYDRYEIVIVDNGTVEPAALEYLQRIDRLDNVHVFREDIPFNYSRLVNLGVEHSRGEYVLLLNNDIEIIQRDWIEEMLSFASQEGVGCVGARLWFPDMTLQHGGVVLGIGGVAGHAHKFLRKGQPGYFSRAGAHQVFSAVTAACLMVRKSIWQAVGGLDERLKVAFNDIDFCIRVREAGYRNIYTPYAEFIHHESASRGTDLSGEKLRRFQQEVETMRTRWQHLLEKDPAYSPNLTLVHEDFSLAWPSRVS